MQNYTLDQLFAAAYYAQEVTTNPSLPNFGESYEYHLNKFLEEQAESK